MMLAVLFMGTGTKRSIDGNTLKSVIRTGTEILAKTGMDTELERKYQKRERQM